MCVIYVYVLGCRGAHKKTVPSPSPLEYNKHAGIEEATRLR